MPINCYPHTKKNYCEPPPPIHYLQSSSNPVLEPAPSFTRVSTTVSTISITKYDYNKMVIPMPNVQISPVPTDAALDLRNTFMALSCWLALVSCCKMFMLLDIIGGAMLLGICGLGFYVLREGAIDM